MNQKMISRLVMGLGILFLVYGLTMDISVDGRIVNLGLANDRLVLILVGGFLFCGGLILFAMNKGRLTREEELVQSVAEKQKWEERKVQIAEVNQGISNRVAKDFVLQRLLHGAATSYFVTTIAGSFFPFANQVYPIWISILFTLVVFIQIFQPIDRYKVISRNWMLASGAVLYVLLHSVVKVTFFRDLDFFMPVTSQEILGFSLLLIPAAIFYYIGKRYLKKMTD